MAIIPIWRWGNRGSQRRSYLSMISQLLNVTVRIRTHVWMSFPYATYLSSWRREAETTCDLCFSFTSLGRSRGSVHVWLISCLTGCRAGLDLLVSWWFSAFPPVPLGLVFLCLSICPQASFPIWSICYEKVSAWARFSMHMAFLFKMQRQSWGGWWSLSCTSDSHVML